MPGKREFFGDLGEHADMLNDENVEISSERSDMGYIAENAVTLFEKMQGAITYGEAVIAASHYQAAQKLARELDDVIRARIVLHDPTLFMDDLRHYDKQQRAKMIAACKSSRSSG
jgi:hypothetical protein